MILILILFLGSQEFYSQEEESAEVYLDEYTDEFQELFFEALKQKGIENYDKAVNLLLECKQLDPQNRVLDHELAKVYLAEKEYISALEYSLEALNSDPENFWYLNTLVEILEGQGRTASSIRERLPYQSRILKENLALIYYKRRNYNEALQILKELKESSFAEDLSAKIRDSIDQVKKTTSPNQPDNVGGEPDPLAEYRQQFENLLVLQEFVKLEELATEALEMFPSQPYFYYMKGRAMVLNKKTNEAVRVLEMALDFLLDDIQLSNDIYTELANAYRALGNLTKANMYLSKIKDGS